MNKSDILLSIITVNYNNANGLRATINSIAPQLNNQITYIVIDGGSTDGSVDIIKEYNDYIYYSCSEHDGGIYQGMNKGVAHANGKYLLFINSGDKLIPEILTKVLPYLNNESADIFYGNIIFSDPLTKTSTLITFPEEVTIQTLSQSYLPHPGSFIRRQLLVERPYDEQYKVVADWDFFVKAIIYGGASTRHLPMTISDFEIGGISSADTGLHDIERKQAYDKLFPRMFMTEVNNMERIRSMACFEQIDKLSKKSNLQRQIRPLLKFALWLNSLFHHLKS